jgi:hypothetical protein
MDSTSFLPVAKTVFISDDVLIDPKSGKTHLLGLYDAIRPAEGHDYPYQLGKLCVFAEFTDGFGELPFHAEITQLATQETVLRTKEHRVRFPHRHACMKVCFRLKECMFPAPGDYAVELYCRDQFIDDRILHLFEPRGPLP